VLADYPRPGRAHDDLLIQLEIDAPIELICCTSAVMRVLMSVFKPFNWELILLKLFATLCALPIRACRVAADVGVFATAGPCAVKVL